MYDFRKVIACSDKIVISRRAGSTTKLIDYSLQHIERPSIPNKALSLSIYYSNVPVSPQKIEEDVKQYNNYIDFLNALPGFVTVFLKNNLTLRKEQALAIWSKEVVTQIFSLKQYYFETPLHIDQDILYDFSFAKLYMASIGGEEVILPIGKTESDYLAEINGKKCIWNWIDDGHDFTYSLWRLLGERYSQNDESTGDNQVIYGFDGYEAYRHDGNVEIQFIKIFYKLEKLGYLESFTIKPENFDPLWRHFGKSDCSIDVALIDESFRKNKLLMQQIELLMWAQPEVLEKPYYILTNKKNNQYLSDKPAQFGGHAKLRIYGRLDCPSANRSIQKGEYVKHRVFFADEETAIKAGYRPCGKCMPEAYRKWKAEN